MLIRKFLPRRLRRIASMSRRQLGYELRANLWFSSVLYAILAIMLAIVAFWLDFSVGLHEHVPTTFIIHHEFLYTVVSTLLAGVITLNAFTFNSTVVILTTFSGQFSPRMMLNFIADSKTQHVLGIFNATFIYLMIAFFMLNENLMDTYVAIPFASFALTLIAMGNFVFFINHSVKWMQVPMLTHNMKVESQSKIMKTLGKDLEPFRTNEPNKTGEELSRKDAYTIYSDKPGFLQIVDYKKMIKNASKDDIIIRLEVRVGDFVTKGIPILSYWPQNGQEVNEYNYQNLLYFGNKKTEVQDLEFGVNKLKEIAIKAISNDDPATAKNVIYQMTDLLLDIATITRFAPYLTDDNNDLRLIIPNESFDYYLNVSFAHILYYAKDDPILINDVLEALTLLAESVEMKDIKCCWEFAEGIARRYNSGERFKYENKKFHSLLRQLAVSAEEIESYNELENDINGGGYQL
ncbi:DUF2254 domain-containing protein [Salsuginibacillus kocurii]|uniref:DUF2254 domain-containing protein n=1 Tax=Salsuginibacillus kocurii TaxID=427078 RepID=UPI00036B9C55|nr:DUF2254 domain-containing protein [Salsuginibacillus kocurii]